MTTTKVGYLAGEVRHEFNVSEQKVIADVEFSCGDIHGYLLAAIKQSHDSPVSTFTPVRSNQDDEINVPPVTTIEHDSKFASAKLMISPPYGQETVGTWCLFGVRRVVCAPRPWGTCFVCRRPASPANGRRRARRTVSVPTPRRMSSCVARFSTRSGSGDANHSLAELAERRPSRSNSSSPRCYARSRTGHPRRKDSGSGGAGVIDIPISIRHLPGLERY
jgi:hypothetical protein